MLAISRASWHHSGMKREFSSETVEALLTAHPGEFARGEQSRTPLHIQFSWHGKEPAQPISREAQGANSILNPNLFNAIGSKLVRGTGHKPVLDVDGGALIQEVTTGSKVIMNAAYNGEYAPTSMLRDVLGDNGIDAEVFTFSRAVSHLSDNINTRVSAVVLRSKDKGVFEAVDSTTERHSHVYIQQELSDSDHSTLLQELGALGIVSSSWLKMVENEGMGVLRTPWTEKAPRHHRS